MTKDDSVLIHYGWHGVRAGGAEAPDAADTDTFGFQVQGSEDGSPANMRYSSPHSEGQGGSKWFWNGYNQSREC